MTLYNSRHTIGLNLETSDEGFKNFFLDLKRTSGLQKLIMELLYYYYKNESVQVDLRQFNLQENEFYGNITKQFTTLVQQHKDNGNEIKGLGGIPEGQLVELMMDVSKALKAQHQPQTAFIQQINPMQYSQGQPYMYGQPTPNYQPIENYEQLKQAMHPQYIEQPTDRLQQSVHVQQNETAPTQQPESIAQSEVAVTTPVLEDTQKREEVEQQDVTPLTVNPLDGLFSSDDEEDEDFEKSQSGKKIPASLGRLKKSIKGQ